MSTAVRTAAPGSRAIGYRVGADGSTLIAFAAPGDANIDGRVDLQDLIQISAAGRFGTRLWADWSQGDVDYDGVFWLFDLVSIANSGMYGGGPYVPPAETGGVGLMAVPEPTTLRLVMVCGAIGLLTFFHRRLCPSRLIP